MSQKRYVEFEYVISKHFTTKVSKQYSQQHFSTSISQQEIIAVGAYSSSTREQINSHQTPILIEFTPSVRNTLGVQSKSLNSNQHENINQRDERALSLVLFSSCSSGRKM